jgi:hypothetical protein
MYMYSTKELRSYKGYLIEPYYHSHEAPNKQWGYRIWKGYELMCVDEVGCKSSRRAVIEAQQEIDKGFLCRFCL